MRRLVGRLPEPWMLDGLAAAAYPAGSDPARGPLRLHPAACGLVAEVASRSYSGPSADPDLVELFSRGSLWLPTMHHWFRFVAGPLAAAFGVERGPVWAPRSRVGAGRGAQLRLALPAEGDGGARRGLTRAALAGELGQHVHGQEDALGRIAAVVAGHLAKRAPARPATLMLLGPTGVGKTSTIERLPAAVAARDATRRLRVHRFDCSELGEDFQVSRLIGAPPGYVGYAERPPLARALRRPGTVLLFDEIEKASPVLLGHVLLGLLDAGRLSTPAGKTVDGRHAIVAFTSNLDAAGLEERLEDVPAADRHGVERACRRHLVEHGVPPELVGRIGAFAVFGPLDPAVRERAAYAALHALAAEYGITLVDVEPPIAGAVVDVADTDLLGARALAHAARDIAGEALAEAALAGLTAVALRAGPPVTAEAAIPVLRPGR